MKLAGSYQVAATSEKVWNALTDPVSLSGCIPGCDGLEPAGQDEYTATMTVGVGRLRAATMPRYPCSTRTLTGRSG